MRLVAVVLADDDVVELERAARAEHLELLGGDVLGGELERLLHRHQRHHLKQVVLQHVADDAVLIEVAAAPLGRRRLLQDHLHARQVLAGPHSAEALIGEAQHHQIHHELLAQIVVHVVRGGAPQQRELLEQRAAARQVLAEGLFQDEALAHRRRLRLRRAARALAAARAELARDRRVQKRRHRKVVQPRHRVVGAGARRRLLARSLHRQPRGRTHGSRRSAPAPARAARRRPPPLLALDEVEELGEGAALDAKLARLEVASSSEGERVVDALARRRERFNDELAKLGGRVAASERLRPRVADDDRVAREQAVLVGVEKGGQQLLPREVAVGAEDDQRARLTGRHRREQRALWSRLLVVLFGVAVVLPLGGRRVAARFRFERWLGRLRHGPPRKERQVRVAAAGGGRRRRFRWRFWRRFFRWQFRCHAAK